MTNIINRNTSSSLLCVHQSNVHTYVLVPTHTHTHTHTYTHSGSINVPAGSVVKIKGKRSKKFHGTWCVCSWIFSCFRKEEPPVGATTFQNEEPSIPEVRASLAIQLSDTMEHLASLSSCVCFVLLLWSFHTVCHIYMVLYIDFFFLYHFCRRNQSHTSICYHPRDWEMKTESVSL